MKKYRYCFLLLFGAVALCLAAGFWYSQRLSGAERQPETQTEEPVSVPEEETSQMSEDQIVINQDQIRPLSEEPLRFLLVSEDGFLLVFGSSRSEICLYTHIPISDFPEEEREKLRHGIWFSKMEEIYSYLESYTS